MTKQLAKRLIRSPYIALPNILEGQALVPELWQDAATGAAQADALLSSLDKAASDPEYLQRFAKQHALLRADGDLQAATAVAGLLAQAERRT